MRLPSFTPRLPRPRPSVAQLRIRLANAIAEGHANLQVQGGLTLRTAMEKRIAEMEVAEEYRPARAPLVAHVWGRLEITTTENHQ